MNKTKLALFVALALQQFSTPLFAQTASGQSKDATLPEVKVQGSRDLDSTYNPPTAVSATKIEAPLRDIPQTVNVVPQQLLRDQAAQSMESVMKSVPGIGLSHGDGQRDQVTIRGFSAIADQFVDGIRDDALYFRDLSNIEQVEVVKGPASVLYGRGSSGGLINRITKKPGIDKSEVTVSAGSWDHKRGEFDLARTFGDSGVAFRVTGAVERSGGYRDEQFLNRDAIAPSLSLKLGANTDLLLQAEHLSDRRVTDFGIPAFNGKPVDVSASRYYGAADAENMDYSQARVTAYGFTLNHRFNDSLSLRNAFRHYEYELNRNNTLVGAVNETARTVNLNRSNVYRDEDGFFNQTELTQKLNTGGIKHQILYGVEIGKQDKDQLFRTQNNIRTGIPLFGYVAPSVPFTVTTAPSTDNKGILKVASAYVQDLVTFSEQWKMLTGVRYDRFEQETQERRVGQRDLQRTDKEWSPRIGLVYQPTTTQSYYVSYSKSFQPSAESFPLAATNAEIAPEKTDNKEIGAKFDFLDGAVSTTASLFQIERTNIKFTDPVTNTLVPVGKQRTNGLELTLTGDLSNGWNVWAGYAYLDAEVTDSPAVDNSDNRAAYKGVPVEGKRPTLTPKHSANLWVTKSFAERYRAGMGVNYVDSRFANAGNTIKLPGYTTVDAMVGYKLAQLDLQLNINNLFDRDYIVSGHGSAPNLNLPGAPRNVMLTARYNF